MIDGESTKVSANNSHILLWSLEPILVRGRVHLDWSPVSRIADVETNRGRKPFLFTFEILGNLESPVKLTAKNMQTLSAIYCLSSPSSCHPQ